MMLFSKYKTLMLGLVVMSAVIAPAVAQAPAPVEIALYRAIFDLKLATPDTSGKIIDIRGKMYFDQDATCDAWSSDRRTSMEYQYAEGPTQIDNSHYVMFEGKDQKQFSFSSERQDGGEDGEKLRGSIEIAPDGSAKAVYARPADLFYELPKGYYMPTAHGVELIRRARAGEKFFTSILFDGTDANGPVEVSAFIGKKLMDEEIKKITSADKKIDASLVPPEAWHMRFAVFPLRDVDSMLAAYEMDVVMHGNGVISYALVDYKLFKLEQKLKAIEKLPGKPCK